MSASEIRNATLRQLRQARRAMLSARWTLSLEGKNQQTREESAREFLRLHHAIQKLENKELGDIRDDLLEIEADLAKGRNRLATALQNLERTKTYLNALASFLEIVSRIVKPII